MAGQQLAALAEEIEDASRALTAALHAGRYVGAAKSTRDVMVAAGKLFQRLNVMNELFDEAYLKAEVDRAIDRSTK